jgi:glycosyltransferase involved in cell wall biosynthesis
MFLSLVIATFNRVELLPRTLDALTSQDVGQDRYEVIFVDDGSTDGTRRLIEEAARSSPRIRYVRIDHTGSPSRPRNTGLREARGDVIVLVDDDVVPDRDFVAAHAAFHRRLPADEDAALGELYLLDDVRQDPMSLFHTFPYHEARRSEILSYLYFWTCNVSVKRRFMLEHGLFDEDAALHPLEDMECGFRLTRAGLRLRFAPQARGCHRHKMDARGIAAKGIRTGRAQSALIRKVPDVGVRQRFGILSRDVSWPRLAVKFSKRIAFRWTDQRLTHAVLRLLGAESGRRTRVSDLYYYLQFRRAMLEGFYSAEAMASARQRGRERPAGFGAELT